MKKNLPIIIALIIVVGAGSFYGGMKYGQSQRPGRGNFADFANLTPEQRQQRMQQAGGGSGRMGGQGGNGATNGEIISKDDKSVTLKLRDGGSKIVFLSDSTEIMRQATGTASDLVVGENLMVTGDANQDGSITAKTMQMRPKVEIPAAIPAK